MTPLRIHAELAGPVQFSSGRLDIDALLMWAKAQAMGLPPIAVQRSDVEIEIPIAKEPGGRFYLASSSIATWDLHERRFVQRRFPIKEAALFGNAKLRRINVSAGAQKSYRIPCEVAHAEHDTLTWFAVGDRAGVESLLPLVSYLGKRRAVGRGRVRRWVVEECASWGEGFPVVRDGLPMRSLPPEWPGLVNPVLQRGVLSPPYWEHWREELLAGP